ncbi:MAG: choice-of-anchor Q domain-containing protein, partial [Anaerolineae bacterium]
GGGIYNKGKMRIDDSDILNNSIPFNSSGDLSRGGGIFNAAELGIYNSLIAYNSAEIGGGIANVDAGLIKMTNSTISQNTALSGGGIRNTDFAKLHVNHSTITQNTINGPSGQEEEAQVGGGIYNDGSARIRLGNSILAENNDYRTVTDPDFSPDCFSAGYGKFESRGHNIIGINTNTCYINGLPSDKNGSGINPFNPMLDTLSNRVHMPLQGSPAIDGGLETPEYLNSVQTYFCVIDDQNNQARPIDGDLNGESRCDIGAAEYLPGGYYEVVLVGFLGIKDDLDVVSFGSVELGQFSKQQLVITNKGPKPVEIKDLSLPDGFDVADRFSPFVLEPEEQTQLMILFAPSDYGSHKGEMSLIVGERRFNWTLVGEATKPDRTETRTESRSTDQK